MLGETSPEEISQLTGFNFTYIDELGEEITYVYVRFVSIIIWTIFCLPLLVGVLGVDMIEDISNAVIHAFAITFRII